jgi:hypothetical protein
MAQSSKPEKRIQALQSRGFLRGPAYTKVSWLMGGAQTSAGVPAAFPVFTSGFNRRLYKRLLVGGTAARKPWPGFYFCQKTKPRIPGFGQRPITVTG